MSQGKRLSAEEELQHGLLPDPEAQAIKCLGDKIREMELRLDVMSQDSEQGATKKTRNNKSSTIHKLKVAGSGSCEIGTSYDESKNTDGAIIFYLGEGI